MVTHNNVDWDNDGRYKQHRYKVSYKCEGTTAFEPPDYSTSFEAINNIAAMAIACEWLRVFPNTEDLLDEGWASTVLDYETGLVVITKGREPGHTEASAPQLMVIVDGQGGTNDKRES